MKNHIIIKGFIPTEVLKEENEQEKRIIESERIKEYNKRVRWRNEAAQRRRDESDYSFRKFLGL